MAMQNIGPCSVIVNDRAPTTTSLSSQAIDAAEPSGDGIGLVFQALGGNITAISFNHTKTGNPGTLRVALEGVGTRAPDGTVKGSGACKWEGSPPGSGRSSYALSTPYNSTVGEVLAATIRAVSGTWDASNNIAASVSLSVSPGETTGPPYALLLTAGSWTVSAYRHPAICVHYADGRTQPLTCPATGVVANTWNSGSSPIYRGIRWDPPLAARLIGAYVGIRCAAADNSHFNLKVFRNAESSPILSAYVDVAKLLYVNSAVIQAAIMLDPTIVYPGNTYRFVVEPTTANNNQQFNAVSFADAASRAIWAGPNLQGTTGTAGSPPTWTDYADRFYPVIPIIDQLEAGLDLPEPLILGA